jgi:hypothetical protein
LWYSSPPSNRTSAHHGGTIGAAQAPAPPPTHTLTGNRASPMMINWFDGVWARTVVMPWCRYGSNAASLLSSRIEVECRNPRLNRPVMTLRSPLLRFRPSPLPPQRPGPKTNLRAPVSLQAASRIARAVRHAGLTCRAQPRKADSPTGSGVFRCRVAPRSFPPSQRRRSHTHLRSRYRDTLWSSEVSILVLT